MTGAIEIDDPADPRVADFMGLKDAQLRRDAFIVEGELAIRALLRSAYRVRAVLLTPPLLERLGPVMGDATVYVASRAVMQQVAGFDIHRGAVASAERRPLPDVDALLGTARRIAILEGLNDHENLGGLFRNAAAFGLDAVLLDPTCADPLYRRSVRVSLGHVLHVPFTRIEPWPGGLARVIAAGFTLVALTPHPDAEPIATMRVDRAAIMLGAEGPGLSVDALAAAQQRVRIPMAPGVDSLNVTAAAAIAFHHLHGDDATATTR